MSPSCTRPKQAPSRLATIRFYSKIRRGSAWKSTTCPEKDCLRTTGNCRRNPCLDTNIIQRRARGRARSPCHVCSILAHYLPRTALFPSDVERLHGKFPPLPHYHFLRR